MDKTLTVLLSAIEEAGEAILQLQRTDFTISNKANREIVTAADLLANDILKTRLTTAFPRIGWLSEESVDDAQRLTYEQVWIVDPIDGTKEFANQIPEYAISVALVTAGQPVMSAVFNPATQELFWAVKGEGAWLNNQKVYCHTSTTTPLVLLASRSEYQRGEWQRFQQKEYVVKVVGSIAYKLALVAAGKADATFSLGPKNEWDIAAGTLLMLEGRGIVTNKDQKPFHFNQPNTLVNGIVATSASVNQQIFSLIHDA